MTWLSFSFWSFKNDRIISCYGCPRIKSMNNLGDCLFIGTLASRTKYDRSHRKVFFKCSVCDLNTRENSVQEFILRIDELLCRPFPLIVTTRITASCKFSSESPISINICMGFVFNELRCNHSDIVPKTKPMTYVFFWISSTMFWLVVFQNTHE